MVQIDGAFTHREEFRNPDTQQRVAIVTGGSQGIGKVTACTLADKGWSVWVTTRDPSRLQFSNGNIHVVGTDLCDSASIHRLVQEVLRFDGRIDALVNNAGYMMIAPCEGSVFDKVQRLFDVNVFAAMRMVNAVMPTMREQRAGHIINLGSGAGLQAVPGLGAFSSAKFALEGYTQALAAEAALWNVKVSTVELGTVKTEWSDNCKTDFGPNVPLYRTLVDRLAHRLKVRTSQSPDCSIVAKVVVSTLSDASPPLRQAMDAGMATFLAQHLSDPSGCFYLERQSAFLEQLLAPRDAELLTRSVA